VTDHGARPRRILVHDFSGHPFQMELSRELAARGNEVLHVYCSSYVTGRGRVEVEPGDPPTLSVQALSMGASFSKYSPITRVRQEAEYGKRFLEVVDSFRPDAVIESNDPLLSKWRIAGRLRKAGIPWTFWLQDLYSVAIANELERRLHLPGRWLGKIPLAIEGRLLRSAACVVVITPDFDGPLNRWGVDPDRRTVIPNWAPIDEIPPRADDPAWARSKGIDAEHVVLYAGTLGLKHDPSLLAHLARKLADQGVAVVVVSEGAGADKLLAEDADVANLHVLPFQPYEDLPAMLASADVVLTILKGDAGVYSVPSKVLTYLSAGRPVVAAVPVVNLAAKVIRDSGGGVVVDPDQPDELVAAVSGLLADDERRRSLGSAGRAYAEANFDIRNIADKFEAGLALPVARLT
jgi:colanic acid biosynthesis glycosyl transferase WcaI